MKTIFFIFILYFQIFNNIKSSTISGSLENFSENSSSLVTSRIIFSKKNSAHFSVPFASVAQVDPIAWCPLESAPETLTQLLDQIVLKVSTSLKKVSDNSPDRCGVLAKRLSTTRDQFYTLLNTSIVAAELARQNQTSKTSTATSTSSSAVDPDPLSTFLKKKINDQVNPTSTPNPLNQGTLRAAAVVQFLGTTADILQSECIPTIEDRSAIQRIVGQMMTIAGLGLATPTGLGLAGVGLIVSLFPGAQRSIDLAVDALMEYQKQTSESAFLCAYRNMQKNSCIMFSDEQDMIINGIDLSFKSGYTYELFRILSSIKQNNPQTYNGMLFLSNLEKSKIQSLAHIYQFCERGRLSEDTVLNEFFGATEMPQGVSEAFRQISSICHSVINFSADLQQNEKVLLEKWNQASGFLNFFYQQIRQTKSPVGEAINTYESYLFYRNTYRGIQSFRDSDNGNLQRSFYLKLIRKLDESISKSSFNSIKKNQMYTFRRSKIKSVKANALRTFLDLCQTFDPTLTCLHVDTQESKFQKNWEESCVGPDSDLCQLQSKEQVLEPTSLHEIYLRSLCPKETENSTWKFWL